MRLESAGQTNTASSCESFSTTPTVRSCLKDYGSAERFLVSFNPSQQYACCADLQAAYMGTAPTLGTVGKAFGGNIPLAWLTAQLIDISEFAGCKDKFSAFQAKSAAQVIAAGFGHLKVTELMHFFLLFKSGRYGRFYGAVDPMVITEALQEFSRERLARVAAFETERDRRERAEEDERHAREAISWEEYKKLLEQREKNQDNNDNLKQQ